MEWLDQFFACVLRLRLGFSLLLLEKVAVRPVAGRTGTKVSENRFLDLGRFVGEQF